MWNARQTTPRDEKAWDQIDVYCDSDWAAFARTRRSTSGIMLKVGGNTLDTWSKTQATVALSSGEAEFVALHQGALAARSFLNEIFDKDFKLVLHTDSTAARAMALRSGPGRAKHVDLKMMFIQELVKKEIVEVRKIGTLNNPADLLTKAVDQATLERLLRSTGVSRFDAPEIAEVTKYVKKSVVHVKQHLSAFMAASIQRMRRALKMTTSRRTSSKVGRRRR